MSRSIIQTAITNKALRLELTYRLPSTVREGDASVEEPTSGTELTFRYGDPPVSDEFACLLRVI